LEDLEISLADQVQKVARTNFAASWEEAGAQNELEDIFALSSMQTLDEAVKNIVQFLGMQPCERSDRVSEGKSSHILLLTGNYCPK
jgi:coatomer subunit gamma